MAKQEFHGRSSVNKGALSVFRLAPAVLLLLVYQPLCQRAVSQVFPKSPVAHAGSVTGTTLSGGEYLNVNDSLQSENGIYKAIMQSDGNFVIYKGSAPVWASNTVRGLGTYFATLEANGNFELHTGTPQRRGPAYWESRTAQAPGEYLLSLGNDGNLAVYRRTALWASRGIAPPPPPPAPAPHQGAVEPAFPILGSQDDCFSGSGGCMHTDVNITKSGDGSGHLNAVTHTWEMTKLRGFRGSVAVAVLDENRNRLWVSGTQSYGVDGTMLGTHDRTENWSDTVPAELVPHVRYFAIIQKWNPKDAFDDINRWLAGISKVADELGPIIKAVATIVGG